MRILAQGYYPYGRIVGLISIAFSPCTAHAQHATKENTLEHTSRLKEHEPGDTVVMIHACPDAHASRGRLSLECSRRLGRQHTASLLKFEL